MGSVRRLGATKKEEVVAAAEELVGIVENSNMEVAGFVTIVFGQRGEKIGYQSASHFPPRFDIMGAIHHEVAGIQGFMLQADADGAFDNGPQDEYEDDEVTDG